MIADFGRSFQKGSVSNTEARLSPFDFENKNHINIIQIRQDILLKCTVECWQHEPYINQAIEELDNIDFIDPDINNERK
ncbi:kinase-like domain-containing protein [Rhizophagus irregularis DAOM 181602=DAOM 197198]|nr:kinase-like domain-containing protein [Rhizophagus irregularis DAOM 181602=DAOM 197198]